MTNDYKDIFNSALEIENESEREQYLVNACADDIDKRRQVDSLLHAHAEAQEFMQPKSTRTDQKMEPAIGEMVGDYKLREKIGEGGMGIVYIAEQTQPVRRKVAMKIIKPGMDTREVIARFQAERQALALMDHPNIAKVFDGGSTASGHPFFVMELVRGVPMTEYCDQARLSTLERLDVFITVCRAVHHAHQRGIIHRDIKPSNVLISLRDGRPVAKIIDFGVAKAVNQQLSDLSVYTRFQQIVGTPLYMSPEQAELSGPDIDTRTDVYSLGVLLYELLTGVTPFDREFFTKATYDEMRRIIREQDPKKASTRISSLSHDDQSRIAEQRCSSAIKLTKQLKGDLDWVLTKALEKERSRRYDSCDALASDIERHLKNEPVEAGPPSTSYRVRKFLRRNRIAAIAVSTVAASLILGIVVATLGMLRAFSESDKKDKANENLAEQMVATKNALKIAKMEKRNAVNTTYLADMQAAHQALQLNNFGLAKRILNRNRFFEADNDPRNWEWRALWLLCQGNAERTIDGRRIEKLLGPEGNWAVSGEKGVRVWDTFTGKTICTLVEDSEPWMVEVSPDGRVLVAGDSAGTIKIWSVPAFNSFHPAMVHGSSLIDIKVSPNGKSLVALGQAGVATLWDVATGRLKKRFPVEGAVKLAISNDMLGLGWRNIIHIVDLNTLDNRIEISTETATDSKWYEVGDLEFSPDSRFIISSNGGSEFFVHRVSDGQQIKRLNGHSLTVSDLAYSQDGKLIASASSDQTIRLWSTETHRPVATLRRHELDVLTIAFSADGQRLFSRGKLGKICIWNISDILNTKWPLRKRNACKGGYYDNSWMSYSRDGKLIATTKHKNDTPNTGFSLRSSDNLEIIQEFTKPADRKTGVRFSPVEDLLVVGDETGSIEIIDLANNRKVSRIVVKNQMKIYPIRFTPDGERLLVIGREKRNREVLYAIYSRSENRLIESWSFPAEALSLAQVSPAAISPTGELVATGHGDGVRIWSMDNLTKPIHVPMANREFLYFDAGWKVGTQPDKGGIIYCLEFSPDGKYLIAGGGLLEILDVDTMQIIGQLNGHMQHVSAIRFSPDGRRVATGGSGKPDALKIWDFETRREIMTLMVEGIDNRQIEWSPDGNSILMMGGDTVLSMWRVPSLEEITENESRDFKAGVINRHRIGR